MEYDNMDMVVLTDEQLAFVEAEKKKVVKDFIEAICKELWDIRRDKDGNIIFCGDITSVDLWEIAKNQFGVEK